MTGEERGAEDGGAEDGGEPPPLSAGTIVGRYRIIQLIGRGGMGVVYRAEHLDLGTLRALKMLAPELAHHPGARSRFLKEAKAAARIEHPHVVKVFDCGEHEGVPFFVMDYLDGEDLESLLGRSTLTTERTAGIMLAICAAISEMHQEGLIHRDLKPGNIFLARNKVRDIVPTVLDFGIARAIERAPTATRTQTGVVLGTAHYIAPEQLLDLPVSELTDQYALGVVLYRCVTGMLPFTGDQAMSIYRRIAIFEPARPSEIRPELPAAFEDLIVRAMSERPSDRFASTFELGKALLPFASPKHRTVWLNYYDRQRSTQGFVSMPIPVAESAAWWARAPAQLAFERKTESAGRAAGEHPVPAVGGSAPLPRTIPLPIERTQLAPAAGGTKPYPLDSVRSVAREQDRSKAQIGEGILPGERRPRVGQRRAMYVAAGLAVAAVAIALTASRVPRRADRPMVAIPEFRPPTGMARRAGLATSVAPHPDEEIAHPEPGTEPSRTARVSGSAYKAVSTKPRSHGHRMSSPRNPTPSPADNSVQEQPDKQDRQEVETSSAYPAVGDPSPSRYPAVR